MKSVIATANEQVSIIEVCRWLGLDVPEILPGTSWKTYCPFGMLHSDGGSEKAFRIYPDSGTAFCFAESESFTPVKLIALERDIRWTAAARLILERIGYQEVDVFERWRKLGELRKPVDRAALAESLRVWCGWQARDWAVIQFHGDVKTRLSRCLALLDAVETVEDVELWRQGCKQAMTIVLKEKEMFDGRAR